MTSSCNLCPRKCNADRVSSVGFCGLGNNLKVARAALHHWEEPCISGSRGSGTVFFCGCNLKCVYCQNIEISQGSAGIEISIERLADIFLRLQSEGAHNINLVTPTHFASQIAEALRLAGDELTVPIVYNCGGYEAKEGLDVIADYADIYLTDMKYADDELAKRYSMAPDYYNVALSALKIMIERAGRPTFDDNGIMQSGVIVRHLVLPFYRRESAEVLRRLKTEFGTESFVLSLMSQYTPNGKLENYPEINRRITTFEYNCVTQTALELGFKTVYTQERSSAKSEYTPPFDLSGIFE